MSALAAIGRRPRSALYGGGSLEQSPESQLHALRQHAEARDWVFEEFVDHGVRGTKARRQALGRLVRAVRARQIDIVVVTKLARLARSTHQLMTLVRELAALGVDLVVLDQQIDTTTPSGRLLFQGLAAVAEFERDLIRERVKAGLERAKAKGVQLGRRSKPVPEADLDAVRAGDLSIGAISRKLKVSRATVRRRLRTAGTS